MRKGFTLVELLVVIAIMAIAGGFILSIFTSSLRGSNKSQIVAIIKQNGQSTLETLDKAIRNSDNIVCATSKNLVINTGGVYTRYRLVEPTTSVNGYIQQDNPVKELDSGTGVLETESQFVNRVCTADSIMPTPTILTDINTQTGVSAKCSGSPCDSFPVFARGKQAGFKDTLTVKFLLAPGVSAPAAVSGDIDPVLFQTTVGLR